MGLSGVLPRRAYYDAFFGPGEPERGKLTGDRYRPRLLARPSARPRRATPLWAYGLPVRRQTLRVVAGPLNHTPARPGRGENQRRTPE